MENRIFEHIDPEKLQQVKALVAGTDKVAITAHMSPDGDAIGSSLALYWWLRNIGKHPVVVMPNMFPDFLGWLKGSEDILIYETQTEVAHRAIVEAELLFCLDYNGLNRISRVKDAVTESKAKRVLIDHHLDPDIECDVIISHPEASAASQLVYHVINGIDGLQHIDLNCAEALYTGLMTDTGNFSYNSQNPDLYIIVSELLKKGINKDVIYNNVFNVYSVSRLRLIGYCLYQKMRIYPEFKTAVIAMSKEECARFNYEKGDTEGLVNMPLQIKEIDVSIFVREDDDKIKISFRSQGEVHVNKMAELFKGGGHKNAAGGESYCSLRRTLHQIENVVRRREEFDFNNKTE